MNTAIPQRLMRPKGAAKENLQTMVRLASMIDLVLYELCTFEFPGKRNNQRNNSKGGWQAPGQEKGNQKGGGKRPHNGHEPEAKKPR